MKLNLIPILNELNEEERAELSKLLNERAVKKGAHIIQAKESATSIMFITSGRARVSLTSQDGKEVILSYIDEGSFFGEIAMLTGEDRSADVTADTDCTILILSQENFEKHCEKFNRLSTALLKLLALRLREASGKIGELALLDVNRRVVSTLRKLSETKIVEGVEQRFITKRPTHQELAAMIGTSREMVTRALKSLEEEEYISLDGKSVTIHELPIGY